MKFKPSVIDTWLNGLPKSLQIACLGVIKDEHDRFEREDYTKEEQVFIDRVKKLGLSSARYKEKIIMGVFQNENI